MLFEGDQEQAFEFQELAEEGSGLLPLHILFCPLNSILIHFTLLFMHKFDGNTY